MVFDGDWLAIWFMQKQSTTYRRCLMVYMCGNSMLIHRKFKWIIFEDDQVFTAHPAHVFCYGDFEVSMDDVYTNTVHTLHMCFAVVTLLFP